MEFDLFMFQFLINVQCTYNITTCLSDCLCVGEKKKTKVIDNNLDPVWDEVSSGC